MDLTPGRQLGNYRVIRALGQGGMGAVYEVEHVKLGVHYALKTYTFEGKHDELLKNKFLAEGKVLARLNDPHLVRVFDLDFDEATGTLYFVMDLILYEDGAARTLADVETSDLDETSILQWFGELASALDYIHAQGIVHRDVKLNNVLLTQDQKVVLSDFGVSRFCTQELRQEISAVNSMVSEVTATGGHLTMGTQGYMAPEVARGEEATQAADAYSLGVMFVYLLTGIWYEPGSKVFRLLETLEYRWIDILPRLLAENPADRPTNLSELVDVVAHRVETEDVRHSANAEGLRVNNKYPLPPKRLLLLALAGLSLLLVAAIAFFVLRSHDGDAVSSPHPRAAQAASSSADIIDTAFGSSGIYESPKP